MKKESLLSVMAALLLIAGGLVVVYACKLLPNALYPNPGTAAAGAVIHDTVTITEAVPERRSEIPVVSVLFSPGSTALEKTEKKKLGMIIKAAAVHSEMCLILDGFSDSSGAASCDNDSVAARRSFSLYKFLCDRGIRKERIYMRSFGSYYNGPGVVGSVRRVDVLLSEVFR